MMKTLIVTCLAALALAASGCKDKPKEVPLAQRAEAAQHASEAEFAAQIRDYSRAEGLLVQATELDSEVARYWMELGAVYKRQGKTGDAKKSYETARKLIKAEYKRDSSTAAALIAEIEVCLLLGEADDAREIQKQMIKDHPDDREAKGFVEANALERMLNSPELKAVGL